jgi:hypothetical protein
MAEQGRLNEEQEGLVRRILASRQFAHADMLKRILRYLVEQSGTAPGQGPKEYEIAVHAMGRSPDFDPRTDPVVRVNLGSVRERLTSFFATEGSSEPWRIEIPKGQYGIVFREAGRESQPARSGAGALERFWQPYFTSNKPTLVVYTEPLFFRDEQGRFFRDWNINSVPHDLDEIRGHFPLAGAEEVAPTYHYLSAGEMHCLLSITRMFHELRIPVETRNSRRSSWQELSQSNIILLGSPRTNHYLRSLQGDYPLLVRDDRIESRTAAGDAAILQGRRFKDGQLPRMTEYAVVTRRPGLVSGGWVTMITANHGRAIEGAGHMLTLEDRVSGLLRRMPLEPGDAFQLLVRVETLEIDDEVTSVDCIEYVKLGKG